MKKKHLHIVSFDIPYPPNYGGVIDVFYKIRALKEIGIDITLHCFAYNQKLEAPELNAFCKEVFYYKRDTRFQKQLSILPYAVYSRKNKQLLKNLLQDDNPILFEGLISSYYLNDKRLKDRRKIFREANIEHDYYRELYKSCKDWKKRMYYLIESFKLKWYEKILSNVQLILSISQEDETQLKSRFPSKKNAFIPCFHSDDQVTSVAGSSDYVLYHGNLSVAENEKAAVYLCSKVFSKLKCKCIIAGMRPSENLIKSASIYENITLIANPDNETMINLVKNAHVNLLITFQSTGMKIKLLNSLFSGRHIIVNSAMVTGTGLHSLCSVADSSAAQIEICNHLLKTPFTENEIERRKEFLFPNYDNKELAKKIADFL